jgi:hypothetical protein
MAFKHLQTHLARGHYKQHLNAVVSRQKHATKVNKIRIAQSRIAPSLDNRI